ncbi:hypothetical protein D623_10020562 [Myotis brandtii]|uniref:Uncharacterized protein n=1 Tax=Myotis brandtii TaxID=109478 RepID=S7Q4S4_MYOBR|nr:hypothetical protein D623_10020562 [Myotis brandtii]
MTHDHRYLSSGCVVTLAPARSEMGNAWGTTATLITAVCCSVLLVAVIGLIVWKRWMGNQ